MTTFSLRDARLNAGLTQRALARRAGVTLSTVQRLEAGQGARPANAKKVADYFDMQVVDLLPRSSEAA